MKVERYKVDEKIGLTEEQVAKRIADNLVNYDNQPKTKSIKQIVLSHIFTYFNFLNFVLAGAVLIVGITSGNFLDSLKNCLFLGVIICNTVIGIVQEVLSKKTIDKLSLLTATKVKVRRAGHEEEHNIDEIVLDDVLILNIGNQVVADAVILKGEVEVNESFITGEEEPILKVKGDNILSGSFIVSGSCSAQVEHIGNQNYISTISSGAKYIKKANSIIMDSFDKILKVISIIIIPLGILLLFNQLKVTDYNITESVFATVAALIGMIPEGLILLTSSVMAVSVLRLAKYNVLVQQLYCIETLARVDVICLDKTGTITEGKMELKKTVPYKNNKKEIDKIIGELINALEDESATFNALKDYYPSSNTYQVKKIIPFSSKRKFSAVEFTSQGSYYIGAPEFVLKEAAKSIKELKDYQEQYRVLVLASNDEPLTETPSNLKVEAFLLIQDKIRESSYETIKYFEQENVQVKIISGDNLLTVMNIAKRAGLSHLRGIDAQELKDEELNKKVEEYDIFGRVTPDQKKKIIMALQNNGHTVAMTGDGVNDVLALKQSDCSIAMASGSDAARNVSQLVLLDSNFDSMPKVVLEGRRTINNIGRSASLLLTKTLFTIILILICIITASEYFFVPIQLTLITAFTIGIPSFILALEPNKERVRGNFLIKIIGKSIPAALTVVFNIVIILLFQELFHFDEGITTNLAVFLTAATGFIFLYRICEPFNKLRTVLYIALLLGFSYAALFHYEFFELNKLSLETTILFIILLFSSLFIFEKLNRLMQIILEKLEEKYENKKNETSFKKI